MKNLIIALAALFMMGGSAMAQWNMGARINDGWGLGAEFSMQRIFSDANRLEIDLGLARWDAGAGHHNMYTTATAAYHWTFPIVAGLQWFIGPGAQIGIHNHYDAVKDANHTRLGLAAVCQGGIEYNFDFPLQLALDARPGIDLLGFAHDEPWLYTYAFSVRYRF